MARLGEWKLVVAAGRSGTGLGSTWRWPMMIVTVPIAWKFRWTRTCRFRHPQSCVAIRRRNLLRHRHLVGHPHPRRGWPPQVIGSCSDRHLHRGWPLRAGSGPHRHRGWPHPAGEGLLLLQWRVHLAGSHLPRSEGSPLHQSRKTVPEIVCP